MLPETAGHRDAWVRCRARVWRVLDRRVGDVSTTWQVAGGSGSSRVFVSPPDLVAPVSVPPRLVSRRRWLRACTAAIATHAPVWWPRSAATLPIDQLAYQHVPAMMLLSGHHRRLLLADEVGMGKTMQAGILLHELHARQPEAATLVIVPAALVEQWVQELRARVEVDAAVLDAASFARESGDRPAVVAASRLGGCWVVSLDLVRQPEVTALLARTCWTLLVVDETHLAAPGTARLTAIATLADVSVRALLLSATPHAAGAAGVAVLRAIGARPGEAAMPVVRRVGSLGGKRPRRTCVLRVALASDHLDICTELDRYLERARLDAVDGGVLPALVLRRRASSCPEALVRTLERRSAVLRATAAVDSDARPPGLFDDLPLTDIEAAEDALVRGRGWESREAEYAAVLRLLAAARRLEPAGRKLHAVVRLVRRCRQPLVIFTTFLDTLRALRAVLPPELAVVTIHGEQPEPLRQQALATFAAGGADVLLATDAAAEGLNLHQRCRLVVHAEVPVSARSFLQRTGRVDRYGQRRRVHTVIVASASNADEEALQRLARGCEAAHAWQQGLPGGTTTGLERRCRRTGVAERQSHKDAARSSHRTSEEDDTPRPVVVSSMPPARWTRWAKRIGVDAGSNTLLLVSVSTAGGPPLSSCREALLIAGVSSAPGVPALPAQLLATVAHRQLRRHRWRWFRLQQWQRDAQHARTRWLRAHDDGPTLFDGPPDAAPVSVVDVACEPAIVHELHAVLRRSR